MSTIALPTLSQEYRLDTSGFSKGQREVDAGFGKLKSSIGGVLKVTGALAGAFGAVSAVSVFKSSIEQAREAAKVTRLTNSVLKSTGSVAGLSAKQVDSLSQRMSNLAGIDDDIIQSGENVLLTFTNVRNEVGAGNDIFNQATEAALNMSAALGTDLQGANIQLGKALNDPIRGITALSRVGVSFTAQQKEQIKTLVEAGDTLSAQKLILRELGTEFGGAAKAAADPIQKLKVTWGNLQEEIGTRALPVLNKLADWLSVNLPKAIDKALLVWEGFTGAFKNGDITSDGLVGIAEHLGAISKLALDKARGFFEFIADHKDAFTVAASGLAAFAVAYKSIQAVSQVGQAAKSLALLTGLFTATEEGALALANPVGLIVAAVVALGVAAYVAYQKFEPFRNVVDTIGRTIRDVAVGAFNALQDAIAPVVHWFEDLWAVFQDGGIVGVFSELGSQIAGLGSTVLGFVEEAGPALGGWILDAVGQLPGLLGGWLSAFGGWVTGTALPWVGSQMLALAGALGNFILDAAAAFPGKAIAFLGAITNWIYGTALPGLIKFASVIGGAILEFASWLVFNAPFELAKLIVRIGSWIVTDAVPSLIRFGVQMGVSLFSWIAREVKELPSKLLTLITSIGTWITRTAIPKMLEFGINLASGIWDGLVGFFKKAPSAALDFGKAIVNGVIHLLNAAIPNSIGFFDLPDNPIPEIHHKGGIVGRQTGARTGTEVPVTALAGEGVLTIATVNSIIADITGRAAPSSALAAAPVAALQPQPGDTYNFDVKGSPVMVDEAELMRMAERARMLQRTAG